MDDLEFAISSDDAVHKKYEAEDGSVVLLKKVRVRYGRDVGYSGTSL